MKNRLALILAAACALLLPGCNIVDSEFAAMEARILANPAPNGIVGMWYRKKSKDVLQPPSTISYLFNSDGTGLNRFKLNELFAQTPLTWKYAGNGQWTVSWGTGANDSAQVRTTGNQLLLYLPKGNRMVLVKNE